MKTNAIKTVAGREQQMRFLIVLISSLKGEFMLPSQGIESIRTADRLEVQKSREDLQGWNEPAGMPTWHDELKTQRPPGGAAAVEKVNRSGQTNSHFRSAQTSRILS
jgi:hypothetical protein